MMDPTQVNLTNLLTNFASMQAVLSSRLVGEESPGNIEHRTS